MAEQKRNIIGRTELIDLPELDFSGLEAKVDTGAYTSSLHCHHVEEDVTDGKSFVRFFLLDPDHPDYEERPIRKPVYSKRDVKSSNGSIETRLFIKTTISLFGADHEIELSLADRSEMKFPILIGRKFISKVNLLVDVNQTNLSLKATT